MLTIRTFYRICVIALLSVLTSVNLYADERAVPTTYASWLDAVNAPYAWNLGYTGKNVVVGVIDDSVDLNHPFISSNIDTSLAINTGVIFNNDVFKQIYPALPTQSPTDTSAVWDRAKVKEESSSKPSTNYGDFHGTSVAGCIASYDEATNTYGGAYNATIVPIRMDFSCQALDATLPGIPDISEYAYHQATTYKNDVIDIKNNSYGLSIGYAAYSSELSLAAIADARANNTLLAFAAGNERDNLFFPDGKDCSKKLYSAHPYTLVVGATGKNDTPDYTAISNFSDYGSCMFICAPGVGIPTADREDVQTGNVFLYNAELISESDVQGVTTGNRNESFNGTSGACPVAVGVLSLAYEAYKSTYPGQVCDVRYIKQLLARTSTKIDLEADEEHTKWTTNAAGFSFSPSYGFGQINAQGLIDAILDPVSVLGGECSTVTPQTVATLNWSNMEITSTEYLKYLTTDIAGGDDDDDASGSSYNFTRFSRSSDPALAAAEDYLSGGTAQYVAPSDFVTLAADPILVYTETKTVTDEMLLNSGIIKQDLEEVVVTLDVSANDPAEGFDVRNLEIILEHNGLQSVLAFADRKSFYHYIESLTWSFTTNAFWGEDPTGDWTLSVYDKGSDNPFSASNVYSTFYMGDLQVNAVPEPSTWALMALGVVGLMYWRKRKN